MSVFNDYARYYDLLYQDKDYNRETTYIHEQIQALKPGARTILNIGCGTGRHDALLKGQGYSVRGVDMSETMISMANELTEPGVLDFEVADARSYRAGKTFDAVISLFHVVNYQNTNQALLDFFHTAAAHLTPGGIFLFDAWYGPALLSDKPFVKTKVMENAALKISRKTTPVIDYNLNVAHINFDVEILDKETGQTSQLAECHSMRYLFHPEIQTLAEQTGFEIQKFTRWMSTETPGEKSWYVLYGLVKV